jgi:hypothetical protein
MPTAIHFHDQLRGARVVIDDVAPENHLAPKDNSLLAAPQLLPQQPLRARRLVPHASRATPQQLPLM